MDSSFGTRLRAQRERQQLTLATIAEQTKIRQSLLEELERDDVSHWPAGIFRRSYLRTYARAIGLDPEEAVREFLQLYPEAAEDTAAAIAQAVAGGEAPGRPRTRFQYLLDSAIGAIPHLRFPSTPGEAATGSGELQASAPAHERAHVEVDLQGMALLCTRLAQAATPSEVALLMAEAARILHSIGMILWIWNAKQSVLWPSLNHGYPQDVLAQLPTVRLESDNAIAAAFRTTETRVVPSSPTRTGAIVVPVQTPTGCAAVLALELREGCERHAGVLALATILAAQLSMLLEAPPLARSATA